MPPKKAPAPKVEESQLVTGAKVLFRLRGYPPWPALVTPRTAISLPEQQLTNVRVDRHRGTYPIECQES